MTIVTDSQNSYLQFMNYNMLIYHIELNNNYHIIQIYIF